MEKKEERKMGGERKGGRKQEIKKVAGGRKSRTGERKRQGNATRGETE
jgi:hypothetical protein